MRTRWRPERPAFVDFETWSPLGSIKHVRRSDYMRTAVPVCLVVRVDGQELRDPSPEALAQVAVGHTLVAHNAPFDEEVWRRAGLPEAEWCDTLPLARASGLPGGLDDLGKALGLEGKSPIGRKLLDTLHGWRQLRPRTLPFWDLLADYCARDVRLLERVWPRLLPACEPDVLDADLAVNRRGVPVDVPWLEEVRVRLAEAQADAEHGFRRATGGLNPRSPSQVKGWLAGRGYTLESVGAEALRDLVVRDEDEDVREAVGARRDLARVVSGKIEAGVRETDDDGRIRHQFAYSAQASGRWSSYGLAFHNAPRPVQTPDGRALDTRELADDPSRVAEFAEQHGVTVVDALSTALRHAVRCERMMVADFGQVEARLLAWLADELGMLEAFRDPSRSVYCETASRVFGRPVAKSDALEYFVGKQLTLGCGYGMAHVKFRDHLARLGGGEFELSATREWVAAFRKAWPAIPALWRAFDEALASVVVQGAGEASVAGGRVTLWRDGDGVQVVLPSGRPLVYREARVERRVPPWGGEAVDCVAYLHPRFGRSDLWGSKLTGHVVQGSARDLLAALVVQLESGSYEPFLHVHDEAACEAGEFEPFMVLASTPPEWADGLPLQAEGYEGTCWTKVHDGWRSAVYQLGRRVK